MQGYQTAKHLSFETSAELSSLKTPIIINVPNRFLCCIHNASTALGKKIGCRSQKEEISHLYNFHSPNTLQYHGQHPAQ